MRTTLHCPGELGPWRNSPGAVATPSAAGLPILGVVPAPRRTACARAGTAAARSHLWASPAVLPPRQPFRSRTSCYPPLPAAQSSSASPPAPYRSACRVSAAYMYPGTLARDSGLSLRLPVVALTVAPCCFCAQLPTVPTHADHSPEPVRAETLWVRRWRHQWPAYRESGPPGRRCPCSCWHHCHRSHLRASPTVSPPRQPFRSRTSRYPPPPAAQSSSASPSAPHRPACRVSAAYPGAPARGSASRRDGSCGRPRRFALLFLCPASAGKRATAPVQPLSAKPNSVAVPSDTPSNGWPSFALRKGAERTQRRVHCQNAGQCTALTDTRLDRMKHTRQKEQLG